MEVWGFWVDNVGIAAAPKPMAVAWSTENSLGVRETLRMDFFCTVGFISKNIRLYNEVSRFKNECKTNMQSYLCVVVIRVIIGFIEVDFGNPYFFMAIDQIENCNICPTIFRVFRSF